MKKKTNITDTLISWIVTNLNGVELTDINRKSFTFTYKSDDKVMKFRYKDDKIKYIELVSGSISSRSKYRMISFWENFFNKKIKELRD